MNLEEKTPMGRLITLPFAALLRWIYSISRSYGLSIILFSLVVTMIMMPFQMKSKRSMVRMGKLSNRQMELQKQYANNQQKYQEELAKLYQEENINPMGGCLWSLLPMFVIVPLYSVIRQPITVFMGLSQEICDTLRTNAEGLGYVAQTLGSGAYGAYEQVFLSDFITRHWNDLNWQEIGGAGSRLMQMHFDFLGVNMGQQPSTAFSNFSWDLGTVGLILIPVLAAVLSYVQTIVISKSNGQSQEQQSSMKMMNLMMPLMSLWICFSMPAGLGLYWIANSVWGMLRESTLGRYYTNKINAEEEERAAKREAARQLRMEEARKKAAAQREQEASRPRKKQAKPQPKPGEKRPATTEAGRVGERPYARGRSYQADRYERKEE